MKISQVSPNAYITKNNFNTELQSTHDPNVMLNSFQGRMSERPCDPELNSGRRDSHRLIATRYNNNYKSQRCVNDNPSFGRGSVKSVFASIGEQYHKIMEPIEKGIAKRLGELIQTKAAKKIVTETEKHGIIKNNLFSHLIVLGSTLLSTFYVVKTLKNDQLDEKKRKTLAINQAAVFVVSTIMAYTFDGVMTTKVDKIKAKFKTLNEGNLKLNDHLNGIEAAKKIIIFATMYRFIAPVVVTPFANAIGNKLNENKADRNKTLYK